MSLIAYDMTIGGAMKDQQINQDLVQNLTGIKSDYVKGTDLLLTQEDLRENKIKGVSNILASLIIQQEVDVVCLQETYEGDTDTDTASVKELVAKLKHVTTLLSPESPQIQNKWTYIYGNNCAILVKTGNLEQQEKEIIGAESLVCKWDDYHVASIHAKSSGLDDDQTQENSPTCQRNASWYRC